MNGHSGQDFQGDKHRLNRGELGCRGEDEGAVGCKQRSGVSQTLSGAREIMRPFPKYTADKTVKGSGPVHLTDRQRAGNQRQAARASSNSDLEAQNLTVNAAHCDTGPTTFIVAS